MNIKLFNTRGCICDSTTINGVEFVDLTDKESEKYNIDLVYLVIFKLINRIEKTLDIFRTCEYYIEYFIYGETVDDEKNLLNEFYKRVKESKYNNFGDTDIDLFSKSIKIDNMDWKDYKTQRNRFDDNIDIDNERYKRFLINLIMNVVNENDKDFPNDIASIQMLLFDKLMMNDENVVLLDSYVCDECFDTVTTHFLEFEL